MQVNDNGQLQIDEEEFDADYFMRVAVRAGKTLNVSVDEAGCKVSFVPDGDSCEVVMQFCEEHGSDPDTKQTIVDLFNGVVPEEDHGYQAS